MVDIPARRADYADLPRPRAAALPPCPSWCRSDHADDVHLPCDCGVDWAAWYVVHCGDEPPGAPRICHHVVIRDDAGSWTRASRPSISRRSCSPRRRRRWRRSGLSTDTDRAAAQSARAEGHRRRAAHAPEPASGPIAPADGAAAWPRAVALTADVGTGRYPFGAAAAAGAARPDDSAAATPRPPGVAIRVSSSDGWTAVA
jgi:hypothetical protein